MGLNNLNLGTSSTDNAGLHRSRDPSVGSFSHRYNYSKIASRDIVPGEELFVNYGGKFEVSIGSQLTLQENLFSHNEKYWSRHYSF